MATSLAFVGTQPLGKQREQSSQWTQVTPLRVSAGWLHGALEQIRELTQLTTNWDGRESPPLQRPSLNTAMLILAALEEFAVDVPSISPVSGGGLQFEWARDGKELELEVLPNGEIEFLLVNPDGTTMENGIPATNVAGTRLLLNWLLSD